jgi:hypothetical protein
MADVYQIFHVNPARRDIRLVKMGSRVWSDDITCTIDTVSLDHSPVYDTLSYVWGDPRVQKHIQLAGNSFSVINNLWTVLRRLRLPTASRVLWIDAICINQNDNDEKSHQVAMMGDIYSNSRKTLI